MRAPLTYRQAGVDLEAGEEAARRIAPLARKTVRREVIGGIGGFAGVGRRAEPPSEDL